jgi:hypothetical protein
MTNKKTIIIYIMKRNSLTSFFGLFSVHSFKSLTVVLTLLLLLDFGFTQKTTAQCIGPYQKFESIKRAAASPFNSLLVADGWSFSTTSPNFSNSASVARSGVNSIIMNTSGMFMQTPVLTTPKDFSFYYRNLSGVVTFKVEYASETDPTFLSPTLLATLTSSATTYTNYTVDLSTLSDVFIRITWVSSTVGTSLFIDDISWTSRINVENIMVVPVQQGNGAPTNCTGGTVVVPSSGTVYEFYDNGGDADRYNNSQTNTVTFTPTGPGFTAGDRVRLRFVSLEGEAANDIINVWDDNGGTLNATTNILSNAIGLPVITDYISTISSDGSLTVRFNSNSVTTFAGFKILVDCVRCPIPSGLSLTGIGSTSASLSWNTTTAGAYDVYYNTTGVLPNGYITPTNSNIGTNSLNLSGLSTGVTYYAWVRSRCGSSPDSYSPWSSSINFTTVDCTAFVVSTNPSSALQSLCVGAGATALTVAATGGTGYTYQWYSNVANSNSGGTVLSGATNSSYTPLTSAAGTLYYYCVITSVIPTCTKSSAVSGAVTVTAPPAISPTATAATGVTSTSFSANWGAVAGATSYFLDVSTVNTFASFVTGYSNLTVGNVVTYPVTGLTSGVTYYYRVRATNSCGTSSSSGTITVTTLSLTYCTPSGAGFPQDPSGITNFTCGTINNNTVIETNNYGNYTAISTNVFIGATIPFSVTYRTGFTYDTNIWVDWNNDGDFADTGELVFTGNSTNSIPTTLSGTFTVPLLNSNSTTTLGTHRLRIGGIDFGPFSDPCRNGNYQAFEDYTINVIAVPPCAVTTPSALTSGSITGTTATLLWTDPAMTPNTIYNYWISTSNIAPPADGSNPIGMGTVTGQLFANVTGLTLGNTYYFWIRVKCDASNYSAWIGSANFITANQDIIIMTNGSITTCNAKFYDSGGLGGNYQNNELFTYTISPSPGNSLKVVFNSFDTESTWDGLLIYNGPNTASPLIPSGLPAGPTAPANSFYGTTSPGTIITPVNGALTFVFNSDTSVIRSGWEATVTCVTLPTITSFSPSSACAGATPVVTLTGTNFTGVTSVKFNGLNATSFTVVNSTTITATLPAGATTGVITIANANASNTSSTSFIVKPIPTTPNAGSNVTICAGQSTTLNATSTSTSNSLLTTLIGGSGCTNGNMFNITTGISPITITSFDITPNLTAVQNVSVYYRAGTYVGNETNSGAWTLLGTYVVNGVDKVLINMPVTNLSIPASSIYGIYIDYNAAYTNGANTYSNSDITITTGAGLCSSFGGVNSPRTFNGRVYYQLNLPLTYSWTPTTGLSNPAIANPVATPSNTTTYSVVTSSNGCSSASSSVTVTVNTLPTVSIPTAGASICANSVVLVTSSGTAATYTWTSTVANTLFTDANAGSPYVPGTNATSIYVKTPVTTTITLTGTNASSGCFATASVTFTVSTKTYNSGFWTPGGPPVNDGTENLVFNTGTYNSSGSLSACSCSVNSATVTFNNGHVLSLQNGLSVANTGSLTFRDSASLIQTNDVANTGNISYWRNSQPCSKYDYTYWASPVAGQTLIGLSPLTVFNGFYDYDPAISNWHLADNSLPMTVGKGYLIKVPDDFPDATATQIFISRFNGVPNNGTIPLTIAHNPANGLHLIGNPYPSAISAIALITDPLNNINNSFLGGTIYFWSHNSTFNVITNTYQSSDYAVWSVLGGTNTYYNGVIGTGNTNTPNGKIASGQGFFIRTIAPGTAYFRNSMRLGATDDNLSTGFYRNATNTSTTTTPDPNDTWEKHRIWLDMSNNSTAYKQLLVGYIEDGTNGLDILFDSEMVDIGGEITFYTKVDDTKLTIQGRGLNFTQDETFLLAYRATVANNYKINLSDYDGLFVNQAIYLEDKMLNIIHDLKESPYYFASESGTFEDRFILRFTPGALSIPAFTENTVVVYKNEEGLTINTGIIPMKSVEIYDVTGRLISAQNGINATQTRFTSLPATNQVLLVQITSETGVKVSKKVVN